MNIFISQMMSCATTVLSAIKIAVVSDYYELTDKLTTAEAAISIGIIVVSVLTIAVALTGCLVAVRQTFPVTVLVINSN